MKNSVFWDVTPSDSCKNRSFGRTCRLHHQGDKNQRARNNVSSNKQLPIKNVIFWDVVTCYTAILTRATRLHIPENNIHQLKHTTKKQSLLVKAKVALRSFILFALTMGAVSSSETATFTRTTRCNIPRDTILHSHRREYVKS
jgi:hypothetical protein